MTQLQKKFETFFAGVFYVTLGTVVAIQVSAQSNAKPSINPASVSAKCDAKTSPDATCSIAPTKPDFKVCFSSKHPRCFELQKTRVVQSLNGMPAHDVTLNSKQVEQVTKAVKEYRAWLESKKAAHPTSVCRNIVTIDLANDHKDVCVSALPKKEMQEKNKALIELLEASPGLKSLRSSDP